MSLVANYSSSDDDNDDENKEKTSASESDSDSGEEKQELTKLPLPSSLNVKSGKAKSMEALRARKTKDNSVYTNRYIREEEQSLAAISKHTSLTAKPEETAEDRKQKKRKEKKRIDKPCIQFFKRGKCKYENDCKFLHSIANNDNNDVDNSTNNSAVPNYAPDISSDASVCETLKKKNKEIQNIHYLNNEHVEIQNEVLGTDDLYWEGNKEAVKKKRPGLPDRIVPSKKALKMYRDLS